MSALRLALDQLYDLLRGDQHLAEELLLAERLDALSRAAFAFCSEPE